VGLAREGSDMLYAVELQAKVSLLVKLDAVEALLGVQFSDAVS